MAFQCFVGGLDDFGTYMLIDRGVNAANLSETGSLVASLPAAIVTDRFEWNLTARMRWAVARDVWMPMLTRPNLIGVAPNRFDRWIRSEEPPRCGVMIILNVWSSKPWGTGIPTASIGVAESVGLAAQLATQCLATHR